MDKPVTQEREVREVEPDDLVVIGDSIFIVQSMRVYPPGNGFGMYVSMHVEVPTDRGPSYDIMLPAEVRLETVRGVKI